MRATLASRFAALLGLALAAAAGVDHAAAADPAAPPVQTAALTPGEEAAEEVALPAILSAADAEAYGRLFALQKAGKWKDADRVVRGLESRLLMGHVLAQRYLHPTKYRSRYRELKAWMAAYADHPEARRIYRLALRRKPNNWRPPKPPLSGFLTGNVYGGVARGPVVPRRRGLTRTQRREAAALDTRIRWYLRKGWTLAAKKLLRGDKVTRLFSTLEYDRARARLGGAYFTAGRDTWALHWAGEAARRSGRYLPEAHWSAGLAAWRLGRRGEAGRHFEAAAAVREASSWLISAAAFWAARVNLLERRPQQVNRWLGVAAAYPRTFYGLLARRSLGISVTFRWTTPRLQRDAIEALAATDGGRRTLALLRVGQRRLAEGELRLLAARTGTRHAHGIVALAVRARLPALAMRLNDWLFPSGAGYDGAAYPLPDWVPPGGFRIDRALIYAMVRQESRFNPRAKSGAGARGLMQLMPRTASFVARDRRLRGAGKRALFEPELNLKLGQNYIEMLLRDEAIRGNLFLLVTAWNGGPGNLAKWRRTVRHMDDPLFFIESIPARETRNFIERVLTNLWIYRHRLGQAMPSLDTIAAGGWPVYTALDQEPAQAVADGQDRGRTRLPPR